MRPIVLIPVAMAVACLATFAQQDPTDPAGGGTAIAEFAKAKAPKGAAPRTAQGKPDFSGVWSPDRTFIYDISSSLKPGETLPIQPWAEELAKKRMSKDDPPEANCLPAGCASHGSLSRGRNRAKLRRISSSCSRGISTPIARSFWTAASTSRPRIWTPPGTETRSALGKATRW